MSDPKLCLDCKHCYLSAGSPGYSEYTPGYGMTFECTKNHWALDDCDTSKADMRSKLTRAATCHDYEPEPARPDGAPDV